jgi:transposase
MFMDNLSVHHNKDIRKLMESYKITYIYNAAYTHEMNPIEMVFNKVKQNFKKKKLGVILNK